MFEILNSTILMNRAIRFMKNNKVQLHINKWVKLTGIPEPELDECYTFLRQIPFIKQSRKDGWWSIRIDKEKFEDFQKKTVQEIFQILGQNFPYQFICWLARECVCDRARKIARDKDTNELYNVYLHKHNIALSTPSEIKSSFDEKISDDEYKKMTEKDKEFIPFATKLADAISARKKINSTSKIGEWTRHFRLLEKVNKIPRTRIKKVLDWYCEMMKKGLPPFTPEAYSGQAFREKFIRIEGAMDRLIDDEPLDFDELSPKDQSLYTKMEADLRHAKHVDLETLPLLVQNLSKHLKKCHHIVEHTVEDENTKHLYLHSLFSTRVFISSYALWIEKEVLGWKGWLGDLSGFSPGQKHWQRYMEEVLRRSGISKNKRLRRILDEANEG